MVNLNDFLSKHKFEYTILNSNNLSEITFSSIGIGINDYIFIADSNYGGDYVNSHITILDSSDMSYLLNSNKKIIYSGILIVISASIDTNISEMLNKLHKENDISTIVHIASRLDSNYFYSELIKYKNDSFEYFQNSLVNECINLMDLLSKDVEIEAIVSTAYKILKNPLIILDKYHRIVAHTPSLGIHDHIWKMLIDDKYCSPSILKIIGYNDFWLRLDKSNEPLFIDNVKFSSHARKALFPIKVRDKSRGYVALLESGKKISPNDLQILKIISKAIAVKFSKEDMVSKAAEMLSENLTKELLLGRMPNEGLASIHCEALGWNLNNYFSVLEIKHLSESKLTDNCLKLISTILKDIFPLCVHTNNTKRAYFLISFKNRKNLYKTAYHNLEAIMKEKKLIGCFGNTVDSLLKINESYKQAKKTGEIVNFLKKRLPEKNLYLYNEIAIYDTILELYKCQPSEKIKNPNLALLKATDKNEKTEYLNTLRHFFNNNQSIGATAEHMFLHRNTIKYRLNKIRELMEDDFDNPLIRLQMHLSLIIDEITSL